MNVRLICILGIGLALVTSAFGQDQESKEYPIRFHRSSTVGEKCRFTSSDSKTVCMTMGIAEESRKQEKRSACEATGTVEVLSVDSLGRATKIAATLDSLEKIEGETKVALVTKGTTVVAERKDKEVVVSAKSPDEKLSEEAIKALQAVLPISKRESKVTDDDLFGTNAKKKVGDSWPVNAEVMAKDASEMFAGVKKENISGTVRLKAVRRLEGVDCLELEAEILIKDTLPALPKGMTVEKTTAEFTVQTVVPVSGSADVRKSNSHMKLQVQGKRASDDGKEISFDSVVESVVKSEASSLK